MQFWVVKSPAWVAGPGQVQDARGSLRLMSAAGGWVAGWSNSTDSLVAAWSCGSAPDSNSAALPLCVRREKSKAGEAETSAGRSSIAGRKPHSEGTGRLLFPTLKPPGAFRIHFPFQNKGGQAPFPARGKQGFPCRNGTPGDCLSMSQDFTHTYPSCQAVLWQGELMQRGWAQTFRVPSS